MTAPRVLVLTGTGINCDLESADAFEAAGGRPELVHVADLAASPERLREFQILMLPGGFSYADDTGSGNALAHRLSHALGDALRDFIDRGGLALGVCNGFQVLVQLGLLPGVEDPTRPGEARSAALLHNDPAGFTCRWVDLEVRGELSPMLQGLERLHLPIAHGEGRFFASDAVLDALEASGQAALRYDASEWPRNPNGACRNIAGVCDPTGRVLGLMPHPERAVSFYQRDDWTRVADRLRREGAPLPETGDGAAIFANAVRYFA